MSSGPRVIVSDPKFRIVRLEDGNSVTYIVEVPDGCDALGVERWRRFEVDKRAQLYSDLLGWIIQRTLKEQKDAENERNAREQVPQERGRG